MWHIKGKPYAVQTEALKRAYGRKGYGWWMEMGLGKTAVALNEYVDLVRRDEVEHLVVICPNSLKWNWVDEAANFGMEGVAAWVWPDAWPPKGLIRAIPRMHVMNYEALLYSGGEWMKDFAKINDGKFMLVADETSRIKNFQASTTKKMIQLAPYAHTVRALSGTPMVNNVMDYWSQLRFIRQALGNPYAFRNRYAVMGGYLGKQVVGIREETRSELQRILDDCSFTALKSEWADLPPKVFPPPRTVSLAPPQYKHYKAMQDDLMTMLGDEAVTAPMVITQLEKLQQISSGFIIDNQDRVHDLVDPARNPKLIEVRNVIEEAGGKVLIFCRHKHAVHILRQALADFRPAFMIGGTSRDGLEHEKKEFNNNPERRVMIAQSSVGGMGHTLLGGTGRDRCSTTIFFENSFALGDRLQSEDRNHRHGQDADCVTYIDIVASPVERKVVAALQKKVHLIQSLREK